MKRRPLLKTLGVAGSGIGIGGISTTLASTPASASTSTGGTIIDDFEDGDLSEYSFDRNAAGASLVSNPTYDGSHALQIDATNTELLSTSGLNYFPRAGDTFSCWVRGTNGAADVNFTYGAQDKNNRYVARVSFDRDNIVLFRYENGTLHTLAQQYGITVGEDSWYNIEINWGDNNTHQFTLQDASGSEVAQISSTDSTWTSGGVGYDAYMNTSGGTVYFDYVTTSTRVLPRHLEVIESFEDGDLSEYTIDRDPSGASIVSSPTFSGSQSLEIDGTGTELLSTSGLKCYPSQGSRFSTWFRGTDGAINITYGAQDKNNRYVAKVNIGNDNLALYRYENGSLHALAQNWNVPVDESTWYELDIVWSQSGGHTVMLRTESRSLVDFVSATDTTWQEGGFGYDAYMSSSGGTVHFDRTQLGERALTASEMSNAKAQIQNSNQYQIITGAAAEDGYAVNISDAVGGRGVNLDTSGFQPQNSQVDQIHVPFDSSSDNLASVDGYVTIPKDRNDIYITAEVADNRGKVGFLYSDGYISDNYTDGYNSSVQ